MRLGMVACRGGVDTWVGVWVQVEGGAVGGPSTCSPSNSLLAATFNTALFTGALWMETQAALCFKYGWL